MNRREFLKTAAAGSAAVVVSGTMAADKAQAPRVKPKTPKLGLTPDEMPKVDLHSEDYYFANKPFAGKVTCNGRPMSGVMVTNGRDTVKTNANGEYVLPEWEAARFVSITTPSGYSCKSHYNEAWGVGGKSFLLEPCAATKAGKGCKFVQITDSEINHASRGTFVADIKALADRENCAFIVHTGDICGRVGMIAHMQIMNDFTMGRRCVYCMGNHDSVSLWPWGESEFEAIYGPSWYSFEAGGVHFLVTPMEGGGDRPSSYTEDQLADWIRGDLALVDPKMPVVLFRHYPPHPNDYDKTGVIFGKERPLDLRTACNYKGCVYGHSHNTWVWHRGDVTMVNASTPWKGGIDHSPNCARVITVTDKGISCETYFGDMKPMKSERAGAVWETKLPAPVLWGGFADGGDALYCATSDDDGAGTGYICALAKSDGKLKWKAKVNNTIKSTLALAQGLVIGTDVESKVYAVDTATGKLAWMTDLSAANRRRAYRGMVAHGTVASPDGTQIVAGIGSTQAVLDAKTGKIVWQSDGRPCKTAVVVAPAFAEGKIVTPYNWSPTICNDAKTGKVLWKHGDCNFPGAKPIIKNGKVLLALHQVLSEIDLATGKVLRSEEFGGKVFAIPGDFLETDKLYLKGTVGHGLLAIDKETWKVVWKARTQPGLIAQSEYETKGMTSLGTTPALVDANTVCATGGDGIIHFWNLADGKEVRTIKTGAPYLASAVVSDDKVFAVDMTGMARAFAI